VPEHDDESSETSKRWVKRVNPGTVGRGSLPVRGPLKRDSDHYPDAVVDDARSLANLQMAFGIVTAWNDQDDPNVELINEIVQSYAAETSVDDVIAGLISLCGLLAVEFSKISKTYDTSAKVLQRLSAFYAAQEGEEGWT
jgi:hypothetical protein